MAEICLDCWNKIRNAKDTKKMYIISRDLDLCEECGEYKRVIVRMKRWYIWKEDIKDFFFALRTLPERLGKDK